MGGQNLAKKTLDELINDLQQDDSKTKMNAVNQIKKMGNKAKEAIKPLAEQLNIEQDNTFRVKVANTLAQFKQDAQEVLPELEKLTQEEDKNLRNAVNNAIEKIKG